MRRIWSISRVALVARRLSPSWDPSTDVSLVTLVHFAKASAQRGLLIDNDEEVECREQRAGPHQ
jgi:hypothetical protein